MNGFDIGAEFADMEDRLENGEVKKCIECGVEISYEEYNEYDGMCRFCSEF